MYVSAVTATTTAESCRGPLWSYSAAMQHSGHFTSTHFTAQLSDNTQPTMSQTLGPCMHPVCGLYGTPSSSIELAMWGKLGSWGNTIPQLQHTT